MKEHRLIDANALREEWLHNGLNEKVYDTNDFLDSIDAAPTINIEAGIAWVSVDDHLPKERGEYIVAYHPCYWDDVKPEMKVGVDSFRGYKNGGNKSWAKNKYQRVTHWMPKPDPPIDSHN